MTKDESDAASAPVRFADFKQRRTIRKRDLGNTSAAEGRAGKMTIDLEEERDRLRAVRVILDCLLPYSGTIKRQRLVKKKNGRASNFNVPKTAAGRSWSDFTRDELEHVVQDGEIAMMLLQIIDDQH